MTEFKSCMIQIQSRQDLHDYFGDSLVYRDTFHIDYLGNVPRNTNYLDIENIDRVYDADLNIACHGNACSGELILRCLEKFYVVIRYSRYFKDCCGFIIVCDDVKTFSYILSNFSDVAWGVHGNRNTLLVEDGVLYRDPIDREHEQKMKQLLDIRDYQIDDFIRRCRLDDPEKAVIRDREYFNRYFGKYFDLQGSFHVDYLGDVARYTNYHHDRKNIDRVYGANLKAKYNGWLLEGELILRCLEKFYVLIRFVEVFHQPTAYIVVCDDAKTFSYILWYTNGDRDICFDDTLLTEDGILYREPRPHEPMMDRLVNNRVKQMNSFIRHRQWRLDNPKDGVFRNTRSGMNSYRVDVYYDLFWIPLDLANLRIGPIESF